MVLENVNGKQLYLGLLARTTEIIKILVYKKWQWIRNGKWNYQISTFRLRILYDPLKTRVRETGFQEKPRQTKIRMINRFQWIIPPNCAAFLHCYRRLKLYIRINLFSESGLVTQITSFPPSPIISANFIFFSVHESLLISEISSLTLRYWTNRLNERIFSSGLLTHCSFFITTGWPSGLHGTTAFFLDLMTGMF